MALVVETGSGSATSDAYVSVTDADARIASVGPSGNTWSATSTPNKELAIRRATAFIDRRYRPQWAGTKKTLTQALAWPRSDVVDYDGFERSNSTVPNEVKNATADLALRFLTTDFDDSSSLTGDISYDRAKVGPLEVEQHFTGDASTSNSFDPTDETLAPVLSGNSGGMERA